MHSVRGLTPSPIPAESPEKISSRVCLCVCLFGLSRLPQKHALVRLNTGLVNKYVCKYACTPTYVMSADEDSKSISLSKAAARMRIKRAGETVEKRHQRLQQQAAKRALAMEKESPEQRRQRLQKKAERAKVSRKKRVS